MLTQKYTFPNGIRRAHGLGNIAVCCDMVLVEITHMYISLSVGHPHDYTCKQSYDWRMGSIITLVRHKKARFESKMHGSTWKSPVRRKNARFDTKMPSPPCINWHCHYETSPTLQWEILFFQFCSNILFLITHREMKMKLYWYEFKYTRYHNENWNVIILFCLWWP